MDPLRPLRGLPRRWHRRVLLHRRPLAALSAGAAVFLGLQAASPPPPSTVTVWSASHDLPGGDVLAGEDLTRTRVPPDAAPRAALGRADAIGRTLAAPLSRGEVLTAVRLVGRGLLAGYPGRTAVPLRVTDADVVPMLRVGDRVTVVAADPDGRQAPETLVESAPVVAIPRARTASSSAQPGRLVVVAVPSWSAIEVAAASAAEYLSVIWTR